MESYLLELNTLLPISAVINKTRENYQLNVTRPISNLLLSDICKMIHLLGHLYNKIFKN